MPTYLLDLEVDTPLYSIAWDWNYGLDRKEVRIKLARLYGDSHNELLDRTWDKLEAELGSRSIPVNARKAPQGYQMNLEENDKPALRSGRPVRQEIRIARVSVKRIIGIGVQVKSIIASERKLGMIKDMGLGIVRSKLNG